MRIVSYLLIILALLYCIYSCYNISQELDSEKAISVQKSEFSNAAAKREEKSKELKKIFIIGASTVRYDYDDQRVGWGTALVNEYMIEPQYGFNQARRGASAVSYLDMNESIRQSKGSAYWNETKRLIKEEMAWGSGGYLLIQFGANDKFENLTQLQFEEALKYYIQEARALNIIPVLITPLETRLRPKGKAYRSRGEYPNYMRKLAMQEGVLLLDLNEKSYQEYKCLSTIKLAKMFGAITYPDGRVDQTHLSANGANIVAGWVKTLACEKDAQLCKQFKN